MGYVGVITHLQSTNHLLTSWDIQVDQSHATQNDATLEVGDTCSSLFVGIYVDFRGGNPSCKLIDPPFSSG